MTTTGRGEYMRLIVYIGEKHINIPCDSIQTDGTIINAYSGEKLVGVFLIGNFDYLYLSEVKPKE